MAKHQRASSGGISKAKNSNSRRGHESEGEIISIWRKRNKRNGNQQRGLIIKPNVTVVISA